MARPAPPHPRTVGRATRAELSVPTQAIAFVTLEERRRWVEAELSRGRCSVQTARSVAQVVAALIEDPPPRPQVLVIDLDTLSGGDLFHVHQIRERGWCGSIIALGTVPASLKMSLKVTGIIQPPFVEDALAAEIARHRSVTEKTTTQIPIALINELREPRSE